MTRYFICSILFLALFTGISTYASAGISPVSTVTVDGNKNERRPEPVKNPAETPLKNNSSDTGPHKPAEKGHAHATGMDETPHIHHFHKNRVKKLKRHHGTCWLMSQLLLVVCHAVLLVMSYLHNVQ